MEYVRALAISGPESLVSCSYRFLLHHELDRVVRG